MMVLTTLLALQLAQTPHPLAADDEPARLAAVSAWAKKKKPQLTSKQARDAKGCVEVPALKETGCDKPAKLCRLHEGDDGSGGTRIESVSMFLEGHETKPLRMWWAATYEPPVKECDPPDHLLGHETPEERDAEVAAWRKKNAREYAACLARVKKKALNDAEEAACDVVVINVCRAEAWVQCKTKNLRKSVTALEHLHRFAF